MSDPKNPVDLVAARETASRLQARDMPGTADDYRAMADEIEALRKGVKQAIATMELTNPEAFSFTLPMLRALLQPS